MSNRDTRISLVTDPNQLVLKKILPLRLAGGGHAPMSPLATPLRWTVYALKDRNRDADVSSAAVSQSQHCDKLSSRDRHAVASVSTVPCKVHETVALQQRHAVRHIAVGSVSCHTCTAVNDIRPSWQ